MNLLGWCPADDIVEKQNYKKYICKDGRLALSREYNNTVYSYGMDATFELPARHYVVHATSQNTN